MLDVVLAEDHPVSRMGLRAALTRPDMRVVAEAVTGEEAIAAFQKHAPHVLLLDLRLPDMDGVEVLTRLRPRAPRAMVVTSHALGDHARRVIEAGGLGFLSKSASPDEIVSCAREVAAGRTFIAPAVKQALEEARAIKPLSAREREVLALLVEGRTNREIGLTLYLAETTVRTHVLHLFEKAVVPF